MSATVNDVKHDHGTATLCNLTFEDFLPGDPPCPDGGWAWEHERYDGSIPPVGTYAYADL